MADASPEPIRATIDFELSGKVWIASIALPSGPKIIAAGTAGGVGRQIGLHLTVLTSDKEKP